MFLLAETSEAAPKSLFIDAAKSTRFSDLVFAEDDGAVSQRHIEI
jgi:hypothetical protein